MKTLQTLIKLQKLYVDEQRQQLAKLQDMLETIEQKIAVLEIEKAREQVAAEENPDARATYGVYLKNMQMKKKVYDQERQAALYAIEIARTKLSELFEEQKRYEVAEEARAEAEAKEENRRDNLALDEIGSVTHERGRGRQPNK
jgi:flagellar protein FliJ